MAAPGIVAGAQHQGFQGRAGIRFHGRPDRAATRIQIDHDQIGRVLGGARDHLAARVQCQARSIEDQVILTADLIDEDQGASPTPGHLGQHARAQVALLHSVGRGRNVDEQVGARGHQLLDGILAIQAPGPEIAIVPHVLADRDAEAMAGEVDRGHGLGRLEIAPFIENVVGRQQRLAMDRDDATLMDERRGVGDPAAHRRLGQELRKPDDHRRRAAGGPAAHPSHQSVKAAHARLHEGGTFQEIARWIARESQLGKHQEIGAGRFRRNQGIFGQAQVAVEVTHGGVYLAECNLHVGYYLRSIPDCVQGCVVQRRTQRSEARVFVHRRMDEVGEQHDAGFALRVDPERAASET